MFVSFKGKGCAQVGAKRGGGDKFEDGEGFGGEEDGELGVDVDAEVSEKVRRSNSERASAASAARGVKTIQHGPHEQPKKKRHTDTQGMLDQLLQTMVSSDVQLDGLIQAATTLPIPAQAPPVVAPIAAESPGSKTRRSITEHNAIIAGYMSEKKAETDPVQIARLDRKIAKARKARDALEGPDDEDED